MSGAMRIVILHFIFYFFLSDMFSQEAKYANTDSLLVDLHILTTTLRDNHPLMYRYTTKERFDNLVQRTELQIKITVVCICQQAVAIDWVWTYKGASHH